MAKARGSFNTALLKNASDSMAKADKLVAQAARAPTSVLPLEMIFERNRNTRELNETHVAGLAESIEALGLLEPLVVDSRGRLLAGGHRLAAIGHLKKNSPEKFEEAFGRGVPVRTLPFDSAEDPNIALAVEVAENEHRRDYTRQEVLTIVERLKEAGYRDTVGRPRKGQKALAPALSTVLGKSIRTVRRVLEDKSEQDAKPELTLDASLRGLRRASAKHLATFGNKRRGKLQEINDAVRALEAAIEAHEE